MCKGRYYCFLLLVALGIGIYRSTLMFHLPVLMLNIRLFQIACEEPIIIIQKRHINGLELYLLNTHTRSVTVRNYQVRSL